MHSSTTLPKLTILRTAQIAQTCHEAVRAYTTSIGTTSPSWEDLPLDEKKGTADAVQFYLDHLDITPQMQYEKYMCQAIADNTIETFVRYSELPESVRVRDRIFYAVIHSFL